MELSAYQSNNRPTQLLEDVSDYLLTSSAIACYESYNVYVRGFAKMLNLPYFLLSVTTIHA